MDMQICFDPSGARDLGLPCSGWGPLEARYPRTWSREAGFVTCSHRIGGAHLQEGREPGTVPRTRLRTICQVAHCGRTDSGVVFEETITQGERKLNRTVSRVSGHWFAKLDWETAPQGTPEIMARGHARRR